MVELTLVFFLGALVAGLMGVLLLPAIWRRALRLTRERLERALPLNANEILAERDRERAVFAVRSLALDQRLEAMQAEVLAAKREVGERLAAEAGMRARLESVEADLATKTKALAKAEAELALRQGEVDRLGGEVIEARERIEGLVAMRADLEQKLRELAVRLEEERRARDEADVHTASARAAEAEERARAQALRNELLARQHEARDAARP
ncbi:MAG: hypothetical protein LCH39_15045 [Proteobacteria bacterium]|nr:hypothetical protein [Pseudomonadota bacterium]